MAKVEGIDRLAKALRKVEERLTGARARRGLGSSVVVGYTAHYALWVHENIEMKWRGFPRDRGVRLVNGVARTGHTPSKARGLYWGPNGQAKFLEAPARTLRRDLAAIVATAMRKGKTLLQGLLLAGLRLQRESQKLVPVESGNLRASAFTRIE